MDDDAGCVEHRTKGRRRAVGYGGDQCSFHLSGRELTTPCLILDLTNEVADDALVQPAPGLGDGRQSQQVIGARNQAPGIDRVHSPPLLAALGPEVGGGGRESNPPGRDARPHRF